MKRKKRQKRRKAPLWLWDYPSGTHLGQADRERPVPGVYQITEGKFSGGMYTATLVDVPDGEPWRVRVVAEDVSGQPENTWEMDAGTWAVLVETDGLRLMDGSGFEP